MRCSLVAEADALVAGRGVVVGAACDGRGASGKLGIFAAALAAAAGTAKCRKSAAKAKIMDTSSQEL
jgi:hypothetical protein